MPSWSDMFTLVSIKKHFHLIYLDYHIVSWSEQIVLTNLFYIKNPRHFRTGDSASLIYIILTRCLVRLSEDYDTVPVVGVVRLNITAVSLDCEARSGNSVVYECVNN